MDNMKAQALRAKMSRTRKRKLDDEAQISIDKWENIKQRKQAMKKNKPKTPEEWKEYNDRMARRAQ